MPCHVASLPGSTLLEVARSIQLRAPRHIGRTPDPALSRRPISRPRNSPGPDPNGHSELPAPPPADERVEIHKWTQDEAEAVLTESWFVSVTAQRLLDMIVAAPGTSPDEMGPLP
jgi:hypothetical protein